MQGIAAVTRLDRRLNAFRPDLADARLAGQVDAQRFAEGVPMRVCMPVVDLRSEPRPDSGPQTQLIYGDNVLMFEDEDGWCWVQSESDGYTGYVSDIALQKPKGAPTHRVCVPRSFVYPGADLRFPHDKALSLGSAVTVTGSSVTRGTEYARLANGEAMIASHLCPIDHYADDYVTAAETLLYTPYLWGGTSAFGIDCSGLVQLCMRTVGRSVVRDSDMQQAVLGLIIEADSNYANLQRGDLVFWKGHVAIVSAPDMLIHASGHTMTVTLEPLNDAIQRIAYLYDLPTLIRRP